MLRGGPLLLLIVALALALAGNASATRQESSTLTRATSLEELLLREINGLRATHGLGPLVPSSALSRAAVNHSRSMALIGFFAHESRNGAPFWQRVKQFYFSNSRSWTVGENLAMFGGVTPSAQSIVTAWMQSPGHRANLLRRSYRDAGIAIVHHPTAGGVFGGRPTWVITLDFGRR
jgi:uncharacterized protein YkwD